MGSVRELPTMAWLRAVLVASIVLGASLAAEAQQDSPGAVPNLGGYDSDTRQSMELACISQKMKGPAAYAACLNQQIASLQGSPGIPNLNGYDGDTRQSMELACISQKTKGPAAYTVCLNQQIDSLKRSPAIPSLSGYDSDTRQSMELACISQKTKGPAPYAVCLKQQIASLQGSPGIANVAGDGSEARQTVATAAPNGGTNSAGSSRGVTAAERPVNAMSRFTTENIMKIHQGISSEKVLEMFGAPKNISQAVCGASVGKPWTCTTWEYGEIPYEWATFTFAGNNGSLKLNNFDVHRN